METDASTSGADPAVLPVPALVLAGGRTSPEFAAEAGVENRALAEIGGRPMVQHVIDALNRAEAVSGVILVAPTGFPPQPGVSEHVTADAGLVPNIRAGLDRCGDASHALIFTADVPFIRPEEVDDHARNCAAAAVDCCYTGVPLEACLKQFPGMKRTSLKTPDGPLTGGNVVFQRIAAFDRQGRLLSEAYRRRKDPLFLVRLIGAGNVLKFLTGRLRLTDIERAASRAMDVRCRIIVTPHAALGTDVDRPEDLRLARLLLSEA